VWLKTNNEEKIREKIEKFALDQNLKIETENGFIRQNNLQPEMRNDIIADKKEDVFEHETHDDYSLEKLEWIAKLDKIPFSANATVDLTIDSDDSDIEVELPPPAELIEVEDDDQERSCREMPSLNSTRSNSINNTRICIQERRTYINTITSLNDTEKPLSFMALRRRSVMLLEEERKRIESKSKKPARTKSVDTGLKSNNSPKKFLKAKRMTNLKNALGDCYVPVSKISEIEMEKFKRGKLKISFFIRKYGKIKKRKSNNLKEKPIKRKLKESPKVSLKRRKIDQKPPQKPQVAKKSSTPNTSSYPDHTKPNLSLLQVFGKEVVEASTPKGKRKRNSQMSKASESTNIEEDSIRIVNVDQDGLEWPINDHQYAHSPWVDPTLNIEVNNEQIHVPESQAIDSFDNISDSEQTEEAPTVNADLLEELLGPRASTYLPDVHASMNNSRASNVSTSQGDETILDTPKKRKYTKRVKPQPIESNERPKRIRKKRNLDI
jgi:hypothetical protein